MGAKTIISSQNNLLFPDEASFATQSTNIHTHKAVPKMAATENSIGIIFIG